LVRLMEKLEKLLQAPSTSINMEIDEKELKKHARTPNMHDSRASMPTVAIEFTKPEGKKSCNDETPPPHVKAKALFIAQKAAEKADTNMTEASMQAKEQSKTQQAVINEGMLQETSRAMLNTETTSTAHQQTDKAELHGENESVEMKPANTPPAMNKAEMTTDNKPNAGIASTKTQEEEPPMPTQEVATMKAPTVISPKEWRYLHNNWLQSAMQVAMGDEAHPDIPNLDEYRYTPRDKPDYEIEVEPMREQVIRYDLCIKVTAGENQVELFHQAFCKWYLKVKEADHQAILYPWKGKGRDEEGVLIENPTDIPTALPLLKKFVNKLFLQTTGGNYYIQVLLGTDVDIETIMQTIRWWLKSTEQGMWKAPLQFAKNTVCVRWLLYSADEYYSTAKPCAETFGI